MDINNIMQSLERKLIFGKNNDFTTINFDVVSINEAQLQIDNLIKDMKLSMKEAIGVVISQWLVKWKQEGIISDYQKNDNNFLIIPYNLGIYNSYIGGQDHYKLYYNYEYENIIA